MTREDRRYPYTTRGDLQTLGSGLQGVVKGSQQQLNVREATLPISNPSAINDETLPRVVRELVEFVEGELSGHLIQMGRFINEQGESSRLSRYARQLYGL